MKKITLPDITPEMQAKAQDIVRYVIKMQSMPTDPKIGLLVISEILKLSKHKEIKLEDKITGGLDDGLNAMLHDGLNDELDAGFHLELYAGLDAGLDAGLNTGFHLELYAGLDAGLDAGLYTGLYAGLDAGLYAGLKAGLHEGLRVGLSNDLKENKKFKLEYCGIFWSWLLARYLIAYSWGVPLDIKKLTLLWGFCRYARIVLSTEINDKIIPVIAPAPKVNFVETGLTSGYIKLPIFELEGEVKLLNVSIHYKNNRKHREGFPAEKIGDKKRWFLNGVQVEQWLAETPVDQLDAKKILDLKNVDQRREGLRRLGMERFVNQVKGIVIDKDYTTKSKYELLAIKLGNKDEIVKFLKMNNPSVEAIHIECVHEDCLTVQDAINWRAYGDEALTNKNLRWEPSELT
jgi:hypothetical protein